MPAVHGEEENGASRPCTCPPRFPHSLRSCYQGLHPLPRSNPGASVLVFNEGHDCAFHQHVNAKTAWKFKNELLRKGHSESRRLCQRTHCAPHHASPGITAAATCPALQPAPAPKTTFCTRGAGADVTPWPHRRPSKCSSETRQISTCPSSANGGEQALLPAKP